jgi:hypothetical protein
MPTEEDFICLKVNILLESTLEGEIEDAMHIVAHNDRPITTAFDATALTGLSELNNTLYI